MSALLGSMATLQNVVKASPDHAVEALARNPSGAFPSPDVISGMLEKAGWVVQDMDQLNL